MITLYEWGLQTVEDGTAVDLIDMYFAADLDTDGLMTWSELMQWLPTVDEYLSIEQQRATMALFKYWDLHYGNEDYALSNDEAITGM